MVRFEELQALWQNQPDAPPATFDPHGLAEELRRFGRQQTWINCVKAAILIGLFVWLVIRTRQAPLAVYGIVLIYIGAIIYLVLDWRNQIGLSRLDFSAPSVEFVRQARARLQHQLNPMRRVFWLLLVTIGGGYDLMLMAPHGATVADRIRQHLTAVALPLVAYVLGQKIREFRFKRECGAVLERLESLLRTLEQNPS